MFALLALFTFSAVAWDPQFTVGLSTDNLAGGPCATSEGCDLARHHIAYLHRHTDLPMHDLSTRWLDRSVRFAANSSGCSSADGKAYCVAKDGVYAYNSTGRVWGTSILTDVSGVSSTLVTAAISGQVSHILSKDLYTFAVIEPASGFVDNTFDVTGFTNLTRAYGGVGPTLVRGGGNGNIVLLANAAGIVEAWNTDIDICWASLYLCEGDCQDNPLETGFYLPHSAPAVVGSTAFFLTSFYADNEDQGGVYVVAVTTGNMLHRLIVDWVLEVAPAGHAVPCESGRHGGIMAIHADGGSNNTILLLCVNSTDRPTALAGVSVATASVLWVQPFPAVSDAMPMFSSTDGASVWAWVGNGLAQVHIQNGTVQRSLSLPGADWGEPVSRLTAICVRFSCEASPPTFLGTFARSKGGVSIGAWTVPPIGKVLQLLWSLDTNSTVVGQLNVLSARQFSPEARPTVIVTTTDGVLAVQSELGDANTMHP